VTAGTVLVVHPSVELYGADRMLVQTVEGFRQAGWRTVVVLPSDGPLVPLLDQAGAEVQIVASPVLRKAFMSPVGVVDYGMSVAAALPRVLRAMARIRPNVVYVSTLTVPVWLAAARLRGVPSVCHVHEAEESVPPLVRRALAAPLLLAGQVLTNSAASRDVLLDQFDGLARRTHVLYNGLVGPDTVTAPRPALEGPVRLVLLGRISWRKGTDVAVDAVAELVARGHDVTLDLVGSVFPGYEWYETQVREQVRAAGLEDRVRWRGVTADQWQPLSEADIVLVPSRMEPFGNTAVEAMLAHRPVVAASSQGLREIVDPRSTGELVEPGDAGQLADAVERLVSDWPRALERAATAAEQARARFSPDRYRADVVAALETGRAPAAPAVADPPAGRTVLVVHPSVELYGADRMLAQTVQGFGEAGWRTVVILPGRGPLVPLLENAGAEVRVVESPVLRKAYMSPSGVVRYAAMVLAALPRVLRCLSTLRPDVVYVSTLTVPVWLAAARLRRLPVVCHVREAEQSVPMLVRRALAAPLLLAGVVLTNSQASRQVLLEQFRGLGERTQVIYNGLAGPASTTEVREQLTSPVRLVLLGRISWRKGTDVAVDALARLVAAGHDVTLDLVGSVFPGYEWYEQEVREQARAAGVQDRVRWRGMADDQWAALAVGDIVLVPSRLEPFGNTAVEAMMARRPLVAAAAQGLQEIVDPASNGELVPPGDAAALAAAIERLILDWPRARARAAWAAEDAGRRFSPQRYRRDIAAVVDDVAGRRRGAA
jgi:glycosyltransferase involved in cell wall biosynthesis